MRHHEFGAAEVLQWEVVPDPQPGAGEVRVAVHAAGVHLIDTTIRAGGDAGAIGRPTLPTTPGREVAGVVDAVGAEVARDWLGRRVVVHLGPRSGGYAEYAIAGADRLHEIPAGLDDAVAVAAIGTGRTAAGILDLAVPTPEDVVAVTSAAGGLGVLLLQAARAVGARTIAITSTGKLDVARRYGADVVLDRLEPRWYDRLTASPTLVLDGVGGDVGRHLFRALAPGGRLVRYGWSGGEVDYDDLHGAVLDVLGPAMLARRGGIAALEEEALGRAADGTRVPLVGTSFPLDRAADAHRALENGTSIGKVVLSVAAR